MSSEDSIVLGIDLGTTFSAMAHVNKFGKPEVITNAEGRATTPSVVHFYDEDGCVVGEEAIKMVVADPDNAVRFIKRQMGEDGFSMEFFGREYTPQQISALILRKLKDDAEEVLGVEVTDAVITVPAYFNSAQRGATSEAGRIAGLNVLSIINEPTAAAIAYGLDRLGEKRTLVVFDLGGGTFDVTVMEINGSKLTTLASDGNAELGGKDWDDCLVNHIADAFVDKYGADPRDDSNAYQELYERCLSAKIALSTKPHAMVAVSYQGKRTGVRVTREEFEELSSHLVHQCADTIEIVLEKANISWDMVDDVLAVGGSTRMPMIQELLKSLSGKEPVKGVNPDECVALGAALAGVFRHRPNHPALNAPAPKPKRPASEPRPPVAPAQPARSGGLQIGLASGGHLAQEPISDSPQMSALPDVQIQDATTHPLGIIVLNKNRQERVVELIAEGTPLPYEFRGRFAYAYENMTAVRVEVTEGHGSSRDEVNVIGKVELTGLPPRPRGTPIEVYYSYGIDQILSVRVVDVQTGRSREGSIRFTGGMSREELDEAASRMERMSVDRRHGRPSL